MTEIVLTIKIYLLCQDNPVVEYLYNGVLLFIMVLKFLQSYGEAFAKL